jgi:alpha-L-fucosidase 2
MMTLELMLMQCDGKRIQLLPAWPKDWTADFKLHAPYQTTIEAHVENGKITKLKVTPKSRAKDVVVVADSGQ